MPASPFASRGSERPIQMERLSTPPLEILPGQQGRTPSRPARCSGLRGRLTRATTDSHRAALLTRQASGASTPLQPLAAPQSRLAIRPLAAKRSPATISISMASRVEAARSRKRRACLLSWGQRTRGTAPINGSRPQDYPRRWVSSRVHCIGWFRGKPRMNLRGGLLPGLALRNLSRHLPIIFPGASPPRIPTFDVRFRLSV